MKKKSVFSFLIRLFLLLQIFTLAAVSLLLLRYARSHDRMVQEQMERSAQECLRQAEEEIATLYLLAADLSEDSRLTGLAYETYPDEYQRSRLILSVLDTFRGYGDFNAHIGDMEVLFSGGLRLSLTGGYETSYTDLPGNEIMLTDYLLLRNGKLTIRADHPMGIRLFGELPDFEIRVTLAENFTKNLLDLFSEGNQQGAFLMLSEYEGESFPFPAGAENDMTDKIRLAMDPSSALEGNREIRAEGNKYQVSVFPMARLPVSMVIWRTAEPLTANMLRTIGAIIMLVLLISGIFLLLLYHANNRVARPLYRLMGAFDEVRQGKLHTRIHHEKEDEFARIYDSFNSMAAHSEKLVSDLKEEHGLLQNAELMQLQAQIDPHFLYNSFNNIKYMAHCEDYEQIIALVSALADYYRFINKETRQLITLSAEVQHMKTYLVIQQMRFEERIRVDVSPLPEGTESLPVPKLILQPLVENCYQYGIHDKLSDGLIRIRFVREKVWENNRESEGLRISVADNGETMTEEKLEILRKRIRNPDEEARSHALANIRRRLELNYGAPDLLTLHLSDLGGLEVQLWLPL